MTETNTTKSWAVKILVIIGFFATILLFIWLGTVAINKLSPSFANLASVAETKQNYKPAEELSVAIDKTVVNSGEPFQISWTDMKQAGEFKFNYECEDEVLLLIRNEDGRLVPMDCSETLTLPATVHGLFLNIDSEGRRFTDVEFSLAFLSNQKEITHVSDAKITVVNASVFANEEVAGDSTETDVEPEPEIEVVYRPAPTPVYTTTYPQSNQYGYVDLETKIIGTGEVRGGAFRLTGSLEADDRNAINFDIHNKGTKTSGYWNFEITLPDGKKHRSSTQAPLKPKEHATFVLEFNVDDDDDFVKITVEAEVSNDSNSSNDKSVWHVAVDGADENRDEVACDSFTVSDDDVERGDYVTLKWRTSNADDVDINNGVGDVDDDGSERVRVYKDTTWTLTARGDGERDTCRVSVDVD